MLVLRDMYIVLVQPESNIPYIVATSPIATAKSTSEKIELAGN